jgi:hypothetical protein
MIHLTLTGINAGMPICGADRQAMPQGTQFVHAVWAPAATRNAEDLCVNCKKIADKSLGVKT